MVSNRSAVKRTALLMPVLVFAGCSILKARPAKTTPFLDHGAELRELRERAPMHGLWFRDREAFYKLKASRKKISVAPVHTAFAEQALVDEGIGDRTLERRRSEMREVARYVREKFKAAILALPSRPLTVLEVPDNDTFVLELSIAEIEPTNPVVNTVGTAAGFFVPGGGLIKRFGTGSIAIEGRVRDGAGGEVLLEFKDREADKEAPFTVRDFQQYAHVRSIIDDWADQYAELAATPYDHAVADSLPFTLDPT